jgi:hypothetical protein
MAAALGNAYAAKDKVVRQALWRAFARDDWEDFHRGIDAVKAAFAAGEQWAVIFVRDTMDGKPAQTIQGDPDAPITVQEVAVRLIAAAKSDPQP